MSEPYNGWLPSVEVVEIGPDAWYGGRRFDRRRAAHGIQEHFAEGDVVGFYGGWREVLETTVFKVGGGFRGAPFMRDHVL